ncbi:Gfo/Idh/MocA family protein [Actinomadura rubrisoli]|uniref:Gfo/Idh/MocA family oxidoreductase n=1 Tax=Actinomadura rubrisoli TaxID=2530368 RepID=A0A4R5CC38_9ACTN|nr:Gfo/Idh/MocA family oxidoreductase [Actinomadura rubrisoli]TDD96419.1 Gfo/Idh/MocA family oxidoreductase [Actinomadura rubrisoli]
MESDSILQSNGDPVGVVLVGAGGIADRHLAALAAHPGFALTGIVDTAAERAREVAGAQGGAAWTTDLTEALAWPRAEAFVVCTPNHTHAPIALPIAAAGRHLMIEKPLATTVADARRVVAAFEAGGGALLVAHTHRFYEYGRTVKAAIDEGAIGRPVLVRLAFLGGWVWPDWRSWILDPDRSGGHALHNGVHLLDLVTWWIGRTPDRVYARGHRRTAAELDVHDYLEMVVTYDDGATAICEMSRGHRPAGLNHRDVVVQGTAGLLTFPWDGAGSVLIDEHGAGTLPGPQNDGFLDQFDAWHIAIRGGPSAVSGPDGVLAVALGVAAERSIATGQPVELADVLGDPGEPSELAESGGLT